jgi:hypothetical protein
MAHLVADEAPATTPTGPWLKLSAALTECVADIAQRQDLLVQCAPGAGRGAPGCFVPALASVELDGTHLGADPRTCDPARPSDRERYPARGRAGARGRACRPHALGVPAGSSDAAASAAVLLEESRIEARHLRRRPGNRHWVRAAIRTLVLCRLPLSRWLDGVRLAVCPTGSHPTAGGYRRTVARPDPGSFVIVVAEQTNPFTRLLK